MREWENEGMREWDNEGMGAAPQAKRKERR